ncbi:Glycine dehydrogenase [decarboxylating] (glycine cleavage system P protein) [hydrothermal vent metagenome]
MAGEWNYPYTRTQALYPVESLVANKYFPPVKRIDNVYGDRNLFCSCIATEEFE